MKYLKLYFLLIFSIQVSISFGQDFQVFQDRTDLDSAYANSDFVILGKVVEEDCSIYKIGYFECRYSIDVKEILKGKPTIVKDTHLEFDSSEIKEIPVNLIFLEKNVADVQLIEESIKRKENESEKNNLRKYILENGKISKGINFIFFVNEIETKKFEVANQETTLVHLIPKKYWQYTIWIRGYDDYLRRKE